MTEHQTTTKTPSLTRRPKLKRGQYAEARALAVGGSTAKQIAAKFGININRAYRVIRDAEVDGGPVKFGASAQSGDDLIRQVTARAAKRVTTIQAVAKAAITAIEARRDTKIAAINVQWSARREAAELEQGIAALTAAYTEQVRQLKERTKARLSGVKVDPIVPVSFPVDRTLTFEPPVLAIQPVITPPPVAQTMRQAEWQATKQNAKARMAAKKVGPAADETSIPATAWSLVHGRGLSVRDAAIRMGISKSDVLSALAAQRPFVDERELARISAMNSPD